MVSKLALPCALRFIRAFGTLKADRQHPERGLAGCAFGDDPTVWNFKSSHHPLILLVQTYRTDKNLTEYQMRQKLRLGSCCRLDTPAPRPSCSRQADSMHTTSKAVQ